MQMNIPARNWLLMTLFLVFGCSSGEVKPIDIHPEDMCSRCRMSVSDQRFASEIITEQGEAITFDDIGCMLTYRTAHVELKISAIYLKDYTTREWIRFEQAAVVKTSIETPMGSGQVAFSDPVRAQEFQQQHPPKEG